MLSKPAHPRACRLHEFAWGAVQVICLAITEPYAGSDVASIRCSAHKDPSGALPGLICTNIVARCNLPS